METLQQKKDSIVEEFSMYDEWLDRYEYLIELGRNLAPYPEEKRSDDHLIKGCQSRVWLDWTLRDGRLYFSADSDALITKGIISLLVDVYSGRTPEEIAADDFAFLEQIGLRENLSPTRANGLVSMIETIRTAATTSVATATPTPAPVLTADDAKALAPLYANVVLALKQVYDPEIPVNIYDLGLIYELHISKEHDVTLKMTFTAPNCPMADQVMAEVKESVEEVPGIKSCNIELVFEPAWDRSMLSDEARVELGLDGDFYDEQSDS